MIMTVTERVISLLNIDIVTASPADHTVEHGLSVYMMEPCISLGSGDMFFYRARDFIPWLLAYHVIYYLVCVMCDVQAYHISI